LPPPDGDIMLGLFAAHSRGLILQHLDV